MVAPPASAAEAKRALRREARALRALHAGDPATDFLPALRRVPAWGAARLVALYLPFGAEPPTAALIADLRARDHAACVPAWREETGAYGLAAFRDGDAVAPGPGGIPEPVARRWTDPAAVDLFLLPGLLFDEAGTRLGHGRGHLDRLLAARRPGAAVLGLAFPWQLLRGAAIPAEPHDVPMDAVVLPDGPVYPLKTTNFRSA